MTGPGAFKRSLPLLILIGLALAAYATHLDRFLSLEALHTYRGVLLSFVVDHRIVAAFGFVGLYTAVVALSLPGGAIMTVAGGFLFGVDIGVLLSVVGASCGAALLFTIARSAVGDPLRKKAGPFLARMSQGFQRDAFSYLLFLRLVPAFPFWVVNLVPALLGMRFVQFVAATAIGIVPGSLVYTAFGASLGNIFDAGQSPSLHDVFSPTLISALIGLGFLALLPVVLRFRRERRP